MFDKIKPLRDRLLVKRIEMEGKTPGGIIIPDAAKEKAQTGKVICAGPGSLNAEGNIIPMAVKAGDIVFFGKYSGTDAGEDHLIISENEILGVVEN